MSSLFITGLVLFGIFALLMLGYINNQLEKNRLEKARRCSELLDRQSRLETLSDAIPQAYLTVPFKQALHQLELGFVRGLLQENADNKKMQARAEELKARIEQGDGYVLTNPATPLRNEEQLKEVRFQLESLHAQLKRAVEEQHLPVATAKQWLAHVQAQLVHLYLDYFHDMGQQHVQRGEARQARLLFERAVTLIRKQQQPKPYQERLAVFEQLLEKTTALVVESNQQGASQGSALAEGVGTLEDEDLWKKKQMYD